jgi:tripartite-type tricarboxylate transporter receptor subunit TctC
VQEQLAQVGFEVWPRPPPDEFALYVKEQLAKWGQLVKQAGIEAQ